MAYKDKNKEKEYQKLYYLKHKEKRIKYNIQFQKTHKEYLNKYRRQYYKTNKEKIKEKRKEYYKKIKEKINNIHRYQSRLSTWKKQNINITWQQYAMLWLKQNRKCAICNKPILLFGIRKDTAQVDHDHKTGKIRGLLCNNCNLIIGNIEKIPDLNPYIKYLEGYK